MLAEERFSLIMEQLDRKRTVTVQELCEALNTSESTIRRDLTELDRQGKLNKVHGGATLPDSRFLADEPTMEAKETLAVEQKRSIAQAAAQLINANDFVFIDAGSTTLELVRALTGDALKASYLTNGVAHARALAQKGCRVYLPGGLLRPQTEAIVGAPTVSIIQQYNFTKAFMGANGVALEAGFTTPDRKKPPSRRQRRTGHRKHGSLWMTPSLPASTRRSSPTCRAVPSSPTAAPIRNTNSSHW